LPHRREQHPKLTAPQRDDLRDLGALGQRHADAVDGDILDLVETMADPELPIYDNRSSLWTDNLAGGDEALGAGPAADHDEIPIAGLRQLTAVETNESVHEETAELPPLGRAGDAPIRAQHETGDAGQIEILVDHLAERDAFSVSCMSERITETAWLPRARTNAILTT
jgi:hypothetical protein